MTYGAFLAELGKAGLTVRAFADLIGMNRNSVSNYARAGEVPQHLALIAALFAEMNMKGMDFQAVVGRVDLAPKKPRGTAKPGRFGGERQNQLEFDA
jgi:transcriptional regulator with XRE-family HTH domain